MTLPENRSKTGFPVPPVPGSTARSAPPRPREHSPEEGDAHKFPDGARSGAQPEQLRSPPALWRRGSSRRRSGVIGSNPTTPLGELFDPVDQLLAEADAADAALLAEALADDQPDLAKLIAEAEAEDHATRVELGLEPADAPFDLEIAALGEGEPWAALGRFPEGLE